MDERGDAAREIQERAIRQRQSGRLERRDLVAMHHGKFRRPDVDHGAGAGKPMRARGVAEVEREHRGETAPDVDIHRVVRAEQYPAEDARAGKQGEVSFEEEIAEPAPKTPPGFAR